MVCDVVVAGAGPNGLMLACELRLAGVHPVVLERLPEPSPENRANGLVGQVVRMLDRRGLYQPLAGESGPPQPMPAFFFGAVPMDLHTLDDNPFYLLPVPQTRIERVLADRAAELGVEIRRGHKLTGLSQHADAVTVEVAGPTGSYEISSRYVVGADGAHSTTRKLAGIRFPGATRNTIVTRIAEVAVPEEFDPATGGLNLPGYGFIPPMYNRTERGVFVYGGSARPDMVATFEWTTDGFDNDTPLTLEEVYDSIHRVMGADLPLRPPEGRGPHRLDRSIGVNTRLADRYRDRRVLLVGDAAHVHFVVGGPGLNLGLQDAINLGWKLAAVIHDWASPGLLDTYGAERRPVGERVAMYSQAQLALLAPGAEVTALRELFSELLRDRHTTAHIANMMAGADIRYDMGTENTHPLIGRWAPDLLLDTGTGTGPVRLADLTTTARPLLLDCTENACLAPEADGWRDRIDIVTARTRDTAATGLLLRPDCYIAWATDTQHPGPDERGSLRAALGTWFGAAAQPPRSRPDSSRSGTGPRSPRVGADQVQS